MTADSPILSAMCIENISDLLNIKNWNLEKKHALGPFSRI